MSFLVVAPDGLVRVDAEPTAETLDIIAPGSRRSIEVRGPGNVRVHLSDDAMLAGKSANVMMTLFCRKHSDLADREAIFGSVALVCSEPGNGRLPVPGWVADELRELRPYSAAAEMGALRPRVN